MAGMEFSARLERVGNEAHAAFERLLFVHGREYVECVEEAKRPETRARRVAATVEGVGRGKHR
jgi:uncharacterized protein YdeI (YjbR/CyaY-like superfamily)